MRRTVFRRTEIRSPRVKGYDYSQGGAYFVTIVAARRRHSFARIRDGCVQLTRWGKIVEEEWFRSARLRREITLYPDEFVVMPNHLHGIVWLTGDSTLGAPEKTPNRAGPTRSRSLSAFVAGFKASVSARIRAASGGSEQRVWQRGYYEHVIRSERTLERIRRYILENPSRWDVDAYARARPRNKKP